MSVVPFQPPAPQRTGLRVSYEEFLELGNEYRHAEWVNGEVVMMAAVDYPHEQMTAFLGKILGFFCEIRGVGELLHEPFQMKLLPDLPGRSPDLFFISNVNRHRLTEKYLSGPADLVIEVISPGSRRLDRVDKFQEYERGGVLEYWLVDPERNIVEFYQLKDGIFEECRPDDNGIFRSTVLSEFWINVNWLLQRPLPPTPDVLRELKVL
jgi:Uma2 family endonuclease